MFLRLEKNGHDRFLSLVLNARFTGIGSESKQSSVAATLLQCETNIKASVIILVRVRASVPNTRYRDS